MCQARSAIESKSRFVCLPCFTACANHAISKGIYMGSSCPTITRPAAQWPRHVKDRISPDYPVRSHFQPLPSTLSIRHSLVFCSYLPNRKHEALLNTCEHALASQVSDGINPPCVLVFYTHHRPRLALRDMNFFQLAQQKGWTCEEVFQRKYPVSASLDPYIRVFMPSSQCSRRTLEMKRCVQQCTVGG